MQGLIGWEAASRVTEENVVRQGNSYAHRSLKANGTPGATVSFLLVSVIIH